MKTPMVTAVTTAVTTAVSDRSDADAMVVARTKCKAATLVQSSTRRAPVGQAGRGARWVR